MGNAYFIFACLFSQYFCRLFCVNKHSINVFVQTGFENKWMTSLTLYTRDFYVTLLVNNPSFPFFRVIVHGCAYLPNLD